MAAGPYHRHVADDRLQARLPAEIRAVWRGPLKGKASQFLIAGARKYLEENGHSAISLQEEILAKRETVLRAEVELQILEMRLAGIQGIARPPSPPAPASPTPPSNGNGHNGRNGNGHTIPETVEKELAAFYRGQVRAHVSHADRQKNLLTKCTDLLARDKDLRARFPTPDALLTEFAKRVL